LERQFTIQPAHNVQLGRTFVNGLTCDLNAFLDRVRVCSFLPGTLVKSAEFTVGNADVRVIKMPVDVVVSRLAVLPATDMIGKLAECVEVCGIVESYTFVKGKAFADFNLL